jgi:hypothetical protein
VTRRHAWLAAVLLLCAGCGGADADGGRATLWVTRDRGAHVLLVRTVPAGLTAMQALAREAKVETRYGGRYVQSIDGIAGSAGAQRDWFYFVNGIESDRGAAEYRLRAGDVEWWDFRSWRGRMEQPVVVGAFPEPLVHGFDGRVRPLAVRYAAPALAPAARRLARSLRAASVGPAREPAPPEANELLLVAGGPCLEARLRSAGGRAGSPVEVVLGGTPPPGARRFRYRYEAPCRG